MVDPMMIAGMVFVAIVFISWALPRRIQAVVLTAMSIIAFGLGVYAAYVAANDPQVWAMGSINAVSFVVFMGILPLIAMTSAWGRFWFDGTKTTPR